MIENPWIKLSYLNDCYNSQQALITKRICIISRIMKKLSLITVSFLLSVIAVAQDLSIFESRTFSVGKDNLPYRVSFPENYNPSQKYPLVVFLHGAGERGIDNQKQLTHGGSLFASNETRQKFQRSWFFPNVLFLIFGQGRD